MSIDDLTNLLENVSIDYTSSSRLSKKQLAVDKLFKPNEKGISEWVTKTELSNNDILNWGNNGVARHSIFFNDNRYIWEKFQLKGKIEKLRTNGFSEIEISKNTRPIRDDIHKYHKSMGCVVCGSMSDLVTDHKNDLYNDPIVLDIKTQNIDDFQCLCNHCNLQKRQVSKKTRETGKRYSAKNIPSLEIFDIDFIEGNETFNKEDINAMKGTYWYDVSAFMQFIKEKQNIKISLNIIDNN